MKYKTIINLIALANIYLIDMKYKTIINLIALANIFERHRI